MITETEPVWYCEDCLSLRIQTTAGPDGSPLDFCGSCGSTSVAQAGMEEWKKMYERRYRKRYVTPHAFSEEERRKFTQHLLFLRK